MTRRRLLEAGARAAAGGVLGATLLNALLGCRRAPGTARDQLLFISEEREIAMGVASYRQLLKAAPLVRNPEVTNMVNKVGRRIADVADKPEYNWEFAVIRDDRMINAFALPPSGSGVRRTVSRNSLCVSWRTRPS